MVLMPYRVPEYVETIFNPHQVVPSQNDQGGEERVIVILHLLI